MTKGSAWVCATTLALAAMLVGATALAQGTPPDAGTPGAVGPESAATPTTAPTQPSATQPSTVDTMRDERRTTEISDQQAQAEDTTTVREEDDTSPREERDRPYYFVGAFYRHTMVPEFLIDLFAEAEDTYLNPAVGAEFTYRRNGFDITGSIWWANFRGDGPFRGNGDDDTKTEIIHSNLSSIFASASFMWSTEFNEYIAFSYGVDVGIGIVLGDLLRSEAYRPSGGGDYGPYSECTGANTGQPDQPGVADGEWCDAAGVAPDDGLTGVTNQREDGVPPVVPWLALPHLALRIKPIRQLMFRVDLGFSVLGFFTGLGVNYGF